MGARFANKGWVNITVWVQPSCDWDKRLSHSEFSRRPEFWHTQEAWFFVLVAVLGLAYFFFIGVVIWDDIKLGWFKVRAFMNGSAVDDANGGGTKRQSYSVLK